MIKYQSYSNLKNSAKIKLDGFFGLAITAWLLLKCMSYVGSSLTNMLVPGNDTTSFILFYLLSLIISVFVGV